MTQAVTLSSPRSREVAKRLIDAAPDGAFCEVKAPRRTDAQNRAMWSILSDISRAKPDGRVMPPEIWKCLFLAACGHQVRFESGIDGEGVIPVGFRSSRLTKAEMSDVIECAIEFGARHGVAFTDKEK